MISGTAVDAAFKQGDQKVSRLRRAAPTLFMVVWSASSELGDTRSGSWGRGRGMQESSPHLTETHGALARCTVLLSPELYLTAGKKAWICSDVPRQLIICPAVTLLPVTQSSCSLTRGFPFSSSHTDDSLSAAAVTHNAPVHHSTTSFTCT